MSTLQVTGRLRDSSVNATDRSVAMWTHLSPLLASMVLGPLAGLAPLIIWLIRRDTSPFVDDHGREVVNMSITGTALLIAGIVTGGILVPVWLVWAIVALIAVIRGAIAANNGEFFRYPMTIRLLT